MQLAEVAYTLRQRASQARRHGGHFGAVPPQMTACAPQTKIVPPKRGLCPEETNRLGAFGVQIEA